MLNEEMLNILKSLPLRDKRSLVNILAKDVRKEESSRQERYSELATILEDIMGEPMQYNSRESRFVWGRTFIAYQMREEGFTSNWIARYLNRDHASVFYMCGKMKEALKHPGMYCDVMPMWDKFQNKINDETLKATI